MNTPEELFNAISEGEDEDLESLAPLVAAVIRSATTGERDPWLASFLNLVNSSVEQTPAHAAYVLDAVAGSLDVPPIDGRIVTFAALGELELPAGSVVTTLHEVTGIERAIAGRIGVSADRVSAYPLIVHPYDAYERGITADLLRNILTARTIARGAKFPSNVARNVAGRGEPMTAPICVLFSVRADEDEAAVGVSRRVHLAAGATAGTSFLAPRKLLGSQVVQASFTVTAVGGPCSAFSHYGYYSERERAYEHVKRLVGREAGFTVSTTVTPIRGSDRSTVRFAFLDPTSGEAISTMTSYPVRMPRLLAAQVGQRIGEFVDLIPEASGVLH